MVSDPESQHSLAMQSLSLEYRDNQPADPKKPPSIQVEGRPVHASTWEKEPSTGTASNAKPKQPFDPRKTSLGDFLRQARVEHVEEETEFWPFALLEKLLPRDRVLDELVLAKINEAKTYRDRIVPQQNESRTTPSKKYLRIFVLLVLLDRVGDIKTFIDKEIGDENLPFQQLKDHPSECFKEWNLKDIDCFRSQQRCVLVQYFDRGPGNEVQHYDIPKGTRLPWLKNDSLAEDTDEPMNGGYGEVRKYKIDPDSHNFRPVLEKAGLDSTWVAVKSLKRLKAKMDKRAFEREVGNLKRFGGQVHRCLITLLATYTLNGRYHLIFPAAECDLDQYWERNEGLLADPNASEVAKLRWISEQIQGLVEALDSIHYPGHDHLGTEIKYGRHGDLKPENILWFESSISKLGMFVITDLGIADIHRDQSKSNVPNKGLPNSPGYRPPECDIQGGKISRAYDIWTLGCVLLEMVCWLLGGNKERDKFLEARTSSYITGASVDIFFDIKKIPNKGYGVQVKPSVTKWIDSLHDKKGCTPYVHDLLDLISDSMLIASSDKRKRTRFLLTKINEMHRQTKDKNYITKRDPMQRYTKPLEPSREELSELLRQTLRNAPFHEERLNGQATTAEEVGQGNGHDGGKCVAS